jgi:ribose-phosphate pyrophosphokinase
MTGDVRDKEVLIIDDMISTSGTIEKAIQALLEAGCSPSGIQVSATHALPCWCGSGTAGKIAYRKIYASDSVRPPEQFPVPLHFGSLASPWRKRFSGWTSVTAVHEEAKH